MKHRFYINVFRMSAHPNSKNVDCYFQGILSNSFKKHRFSSKADSEMLVNF